MTFPQQEILASLVGRVFRIEDVTLGDPTKGYIARFRGRLIAEDTVAAYDQLAAAVRPYNITPLFRKDKGSGHVILLVSGVVQPKPSKIRTNVILFILTVLSVLFVGSSYADPQQLAGATSTLDLIWRSVLAGLPFAASLLGILVAHEFGHYLMARYHKTSATLPYFLPLPVPPLGTLGAVIIWKEPPKNKRTLLDVGIAGPLAGLVVAIPILLYGLSISKLGPIIQPATAGVSLMEGNSILYLLAKFTVFGKWLPAPASYGSTPALLYWLHYFFTGGPIPFGGIDVFTNAVAFAGWAGLLVTALNLVPAGQLDGGHVMYVLFGQRLRVALPVIIAILAVLGFFWSGWWLWILLLLIFGRQYAEPLDQITELDPRRRALAILALVIFVLVFTPVPFVVY